jgi:hypothetical protein
MPQELPSRSRRQGHIKSDIKCIPSLKLIIQRGRKTFVECIQSLPLCSSWSITFFQPTRREAPVKTQELHAGKLHFMVHGTDWSVQSRKPSSHSGRIYRRSQKKTLDPARVAGACKCHHVKVNIGCTSLIHWPQTQPRKYLKVPHAFVAHENRNCGVIISQESTDTRNPSQIAPTVTRYTLVKIPIHSGTITFR